MSPSGQRSDRARARSRSTHRQWGRAHRLPGRRPAGTREDPRLGRAARHVGPDPPRRAVRHRALLHFIPDSDDPYGIVRRYLDALPAGSYLALTHVTPDFAPEDVQRVVDVYRGQGIPATVRTRSEVARFFDGLDVVEPGVQPVHRWRPDDSGPDGPTDAEVDVYGGLARLP
ncbi:protein of unknown function DUF574 [Parafrankia sp. EAN1pec]|nr:protein of unknown function DUF574 [Frankia sp. EAN1pec]